MSECGCGKPTRDERFVCDDCSDSLSRALGDIPWLDEELETTITKRRGIDYRRVGGGKGGKTAPRNDKRIEGDRTKEPTSLDAPEFGAAMQGDLGDWTASNARTHLKGVLVAWVLFCVQERVRNSSPHLGLPTDDLPAISRWLMWRVDGLALHDIGAEAVEEITSAVAHCHRLIDTRPQKQYAGQCGSVQDDGPCKADLYARAGARTITCRDCDTEWDVKERRDYLLAEAEEVLATAPEIARAVSWLGAQALTADRVRQWAARDRLVVRGHDRTGRPMYRVGDAIDLLSQTTKGATA